MVTEYDLIEAVRAVKHEMAGFVGRQMQSAEAAMILRVSEALNRAIEARVGEMADKMMDSLVNRLEDTERKSTESMQTLVDLIKALPTPQVSFNPNIQPGAAPVVNVAPAQVTVTSPEVTVNVPEAQVQVTVPVPSVTVESPQVNVSPAQVTVSAPEPKLMRKFITYDEKGRPSQITETDLI